MSVRGDKLRLIVILIIIINLTSGLLNTSLLVDGMGEPTTHTTTNNRNFEIHERRKDTCL